MVNDKDMVDEWTADIEEIEKEEILLESRKYYDQT